MEHGIHFLGVGSVGKYVAYALMRLRLQNSHNTTGSPPLTLLFQQADRLQSWKDADCSIRYIVHPALRLASRTKLEEDGSADGFRVEVALQPPPAPGQGRGSFPKMPKMEALDRWVASKASSAGVAIVPASGPIKHLVVATKATVTASALARVRHRLDKDSHVVFLQNGLGITDEISSRLFPDAATRPQYWAGVCSAGITSNGPFAITHAGLGPLIVGRVPDRDRELLVDRDNEPLPLVVTQLLDAPLLQTELVSADRLRAVQLGKLVVNSVINPLTAILECENGQILERKEGRRMMGLLLEEAGPIVRALLSEAGTLQRWGEEFSDTALRNRVVQVAESTALNISSMLQDVRDNKRTEIYYINRYLATEAKRLGLPCKHHMEVVGTVNRLMNGRSNVRGHSAGSMRE